MKKAIGSALLALCLAAPGVAFAKDATATFQVSGWHCGGCTGKTEAALKKIKGVKTATADLDKGEVAVAYDDSVTNEAALKNAIKTAGFKAESAKSETKKN